ncbi:hypothetical protein SeLEV6574_g06060 [Synchytrium endobioticum]|uniref:Diacylglycerol O-acyltransferase n=1 Tax=Synchytrium endobioticum TaxID=286115 RepID=A0A507CQT6_9FUNG|nr:hypothetical protein SeLEV6574_g06060 [Synchytrium endobioticum]
MKLDQAIRSRTEPNGLDRKPVSIEKSKDRKPAKGLGPLGSFIRQHFAVCYYVFHSFLFMAILWWCLSHWRAFWPMIIAYSIHMWMDRHTARTGGTDRYQWVLDLPLWSWYADYFSLQLVRTTPLNPDGNYLFGYHPHGIYVFGTPILVTNQCNFRELYPNIKLRIGTLDLNFYAPLWREMQLAMKLISVSAESIKTVLKKGPGWSVALVIGGAQESMLAYPGTNDLVLKRRRGFVRIAIETGAALVPIFVFGENDLYYQTTPERNPKVTAFQKWLQKRCGFSVPFGYGKFGWIPRRRKLTAVVGAPIHVQKQDCPPKEYIEEMHAKYIQSLAKLYDTYKDEYASDRIRDMRIVQ